MSHIGVCLLDVSVQLTPPLEIFLASRAPGLIAFLVGVERHLRSCVDVGCILIVAGGCLSLYTRVSFMYCLLIVETT